MLEHIAIALAIEVVIAFVLRSWAAGVATSCAWSICREITQAEYRWIEHFGGGLRANMPWWGGLDPRVWQRADPWLDVDRTLRSGAYPGDRRQPRRLERETPTPSLTPRRAYFSLISRRRSWR